MLLNTKTQVGLKIADDREMQDGVISNHTEKLEQWAKDGFITKTDLDFGAKNATELVLDKGEYINQNYLIRDTAMDMVKKIPLNDKFDIKFLKNLPVKKATFLLGNELAMKYYKTADNVYGIIYFYNEKDNWLTWSFFRINLVTGEVLFPDTKNRNSEEGKRYAGYIDEIQRDVYAEPNFRLFIQLLLFIELSDLVIEVLPPNRKTGTKKNGKLFNKSNSDISIVDSKWNVTSIRTDSFMVSGHWRMQPFGESMEQRKLIWIDTFEKHGYIRKAKTTNTNLNTINHG